MRQVPLADAQKNLAELVNELPQEGEFVITVANRPVARLAPFSERTSLRDLKPLSVGAVLRPYPKADDDLLGEMLDGQR